MRVLMMALILWGLSLPAHAQGNAEEAIQAELKLAETDGLLELSSHCTNNSGRTRSLSYKLKMLRVDTRGNRSSSKQGGMFELADGAERLLSTTSVNIDDGSYVLATLEIYEGEEKLAMARQVIGEIPAEEGKPKSGQGRGAVPSPDAGQDRYGSSGQDVQINMGFIADDTRTRAGSQFYDVFYRSWKEPQVDIDYIIRIEERPARGRSTMISVSLDGEEIFSRMLQPKPEYIERLAVGVANFTYQKVVQKAQVGDALEHEQVGSDMY